MRCMHQLLAPVEKRIGISGEDNGSGPITCKLRTLNFQPICRENYAGKLHDFINNDLCQFLMDNHVESEQHIHNSTPQICLTDLPVGQPS